MLNLMAVPVCQKARWVYILQNELDLEELKGSLYYAVETGSCHSAGYVSSSKDLRAHGALRIIKLMKNNNR